MPKRHRAMRKQIIASGDVEVVRIKRHNVVALRPVQLAPFQYAVFEDIRRIVIARARPSVEIGIDAPQLTVLNRDGAVKRAAGQIAPAQCRCHERHIGEPQRQGDAVDEGHRSGIRDPTLRLFLNRVKCLQPVESLWLPLADDRAGPLLCDQLRPVTAHRDAIGQCQHGVSHVQRSPNVIQRPIMKSNVQGVRVPLSLWRERCVHSERIG